MKLAIRQTGVCRLLVTIILAGGIVGIGAQSASAACASTATASDWSTNCITSATSNKYSRYTLAIQYILKRKGYYGGALDGDFGTGTYTAVVNWQTDHSLSSDGIVGTNTWMSLRSALALSQASTSCAGRTAYFYSAGDVAPFHRINSTGTWLVMKKGLSVPTSCSDLYTMSTSAP